MHLPLHVESHEVENGLQQHYFGQAVFLGEDRMKPSHPSSSIPHLVDAELARHRAAARVGDVGGAWWALERAHILSQPRLPLHLRVHWSMLIYALRLHDLREVAGQVARLALAPLAAMTGRVPVGNTGRSNLSAFRPMPIPDDLRSVMDGGPR